MQPIFTGNPDFRKSAFLNWRTSKNADIQNLLVLADGFLISSIELTKLCLSNNDDKKADVLIFPILANANHGIELYLKALVWTLNKLLGTQYKIEGNHNISQILSTVKSKIKEYKGQEGLNYFNDQTEILQKYIKELFDKVQATPQNDKMDFSRYPFDKKYDKHFYVDELNNVEIDLVNFLSQLETIHRILDERASYFFHQELNQDW
ncbi:MAG: hypothetical protein L6Q81_12905 [Bacteroidia bacterium]|nr:hypothetical protein [Bacteroidia bacterium]